MERVPIVKRGVYLEARERSEAMTESWPLIAPQAVTDRVYEAIRGRILRGELPPLSFMRQDEISGAMGVSRTPVREALMRLVSDGYVERVHRRGFRVASESIQDQVALYPILAALEGLACRTAFPRLQRADLAGLRQLNRDLRRAIAAGDARAAIDINQRFHQALAAKSGNNRLTRLLHDLSTEITRLEIWSFSSQGDRDQTMADHDAILQALERGDRAAALAHLEHDRLSAYRQYLAEIGPPDGPRDPPPAPRAARARASAPP